MNLRILSSSLSLAALFGATLASASELKVVDGTGSTRLVAEVSGQSRNGIEVVARSTNPTTLTDGVEVQLASLEQGDEVLSMRLTSEGKGYFNAVPAGNFRVTTPAQGIEIESVQLASNDDNPVAGAVVGGEGGAAGAVSADAAAGGAVVGDAAVGAGAAAGAGTGVAGVGLGAGGIVLAGAGAIGIGAAAISEGTKDAAPGPVIPPVPSAN